MPPVSGRLLLMYYMPRVYAPCSLKRWGMDVARCVGWINTASHVQAPNKPRSSRGFRQGIWSRRSFPKERSGEPTTDAWPYARVAPSISPRPTEPYKALAIGIVRSFTAVMAIVTRKERRRSLPSPTGRRVSMPQFDERKSATRRHWPDQGDHKGSPSELYCC